MEVMRISGEQITESYSQCRRLDDLIHALEREAQLRQRVICRVKVNGLSLSESDEVRLGESELSTIQEVEIETESVEELKRDSVQTFIQLSAALSNEVIRLADTYRGYALHGSSEDGETRSHFMAVIKNTQTLTDALIVFKPILEEKNPSPEFADCWNNSESHTIATLRELTEAYQTEDWPLLADVLEYELSTTLDKWRTLLVGQIDMR